MNNEFIPFEQALALKELGFNEPCFKVYDDMGFLQEESVMNTCEIECDCVLEKHLAPLYQQAFRWFREKYRISLIITCYSELGNAWKYHIPNEDGEQGFNTYEQAELACLIKLIELVKKELKWTKN
jgi:hypothetical protein